MEIPNMFAVPSGGLVMDVYFDNIFSDVSFCSKIMKSKKDLDDITAKADVEMRRSLERFSNI